MSKSNKYALAGAERKAQITEAGAKLAAKYGAVNVTRRMVAAAAKVSEALVSAHMGATEEAQKAYRRALKKLGLSEPDKASIEAHGIKLRQHKPRDARDTRKRSPKEVEAIKRKAPAKKAAVKKVPVKKSTVSVTTKTTKNGTVVTMKSRRSGVDLRTMAPPATKPVKSPGKPAQPKEQKVVTTPGSAPKPPSTARKSAARKPMAPPPASPVLPLPGALPLPE